MSSPRCKFAVERYCRIIALEYDLSLLSTDGYSKKGTKDGRNLSPENISEKAIRKSASLQERRMLQVKAVQEEIRALRSEISTSKSIPSESDVEAEVVERLRQLQEKSNILSPDESRLKRSKGLARLFSECAAIGHGAYLDETRVLMRSKSGSLHESMRPPINREVDTFDCAPAAFGPRAQGETGVVVQGFPSDGCAGTLRGSSGASLRGKIVLLRRGGCTFASKARNAEKAGALAVIIARQVPGAPIIMSNSLESATSLGGRRAIKIPVVMISNDSSVQITQAMSLGTVECSLVMTRDPPLPFPQVWEERGQGKVVVDVGHEWGVELVRGDSWPFEEGESELGWQLQIVDLRGE
jgi:hypothetical protein